MSLFLLFACTSADEAPAPAAGRLVDRAYVVSEESDELFVFDHVTLEAVGSVDTNVEAGVVNGNHMAMVSPDGAKVYISATHTNALVVVDAASLAVSKVLPVGNHDTHMAMREGTSELWVMNEDDDSVAIVDMESDTVVRTLTDDSFVVPHFAHFSDGRAYVPSIAGNQISIVDLESYEVVDTILAAGVTEPGACAGDPCGYADAQIGPDGVLYASHIETGSVVTYDTLAHARLADVTVGAQPWSAFVDPFGDTVGAAFVPSWSDATVSRVSAAGERIVSAAGDSEVYGVNYSPLAPEVAFVLNRTREQVAVIDRASGEAVDAIDVGGTTETATTTADGRLLVPVSSAGSVLVIDPASLEVLATFDGVGTYPWSVTTVEGQNYCH